MKKLWITMLVILFSSEAFAEGRYLVGYEWYVRLIAEVPSKNMKDRGNVIGQLYESNASKDSHDLMELAPFGANYLTIVFPHPEWGADAGDYTSDYHSRENYRNDMWEFEVRTSATYDDVTLTWDKVKLLGTYTNGNDPEGLEHIYKKVLRKLSLKTGEEYNYNPQEWTHTIEEKDGITEMTLYRNGEQILQKRFDTAKLMNREERILKRLEKRMRLVDIQTGQEVKAVLDGVRQSYTFNMNGSNVRKFKWLLEPHNILTEADRKRIRELRNMSTKPQTQLKRNNTKQIKRNDTKFEELPTPAQPK